MTWQAWAVLSATFAAAAAICIKLGLAKMDPDYAMCLRSVVITAFALLFVLANGKWENPFALDGWSVVFIILAAVAACASLVCYFRGLQQGPVSQVAAIDKLSVVIVVVVGVLLLREYPSRIQWLGLALVASGAFVLALGPVSGVKQ
jgi:transporter family protein